MNLPRPRFHTHTGTNSLFLLYHCHNGRLLYASLFNRRYYWETHEVLEGLWLESSGSEKVFLQGLIQAAAAFYHVLNANPQGVLKLSQSAQEKLKGFGETHMSVPLENLRTQLSFFKDQAREILGNTRSGFDYNQLPRLTIGSDMDK